VHEPQRRSSAQGGQTVLTLPAEIDVTNAREVAQQLAVTLRPGATSVIADLTATSFCDSAGIRAIAAACMQAAESGIELRLAVPSPAVLRVITLTGLDRSLAIYPTLEQALAPEPSPSGFIARQLPGSWSRR
jgi:anti-sigma B factor antagonist